MKTDDNFPSDILSLTVPSADDVLTMPLSPKPEKGGMNDSNITDDNEDDRQNTVVYRKNLISFWLFGLCNNFAYVVMLSAAHDILDDDDDDDDDDNISNGTTSSPSNHTYLDCNGVGAGAILLADVLPALVIKMTVPFFIQSISYKTKIFVTAIFAFGSFIIVATSHVIWLSILGVICASISIGLGENTFLSLTTYYHINVVSMWSSGTGAAGVFGALVYAGLTSAGFSPRNTLLTMTTIPVTMVLTFLFLLTKPEVDNFDNEMTAILSSNERKQNTSPRFREMLTTIPPLFKYMVPLTLVYFAEYFINQGLHELLYFKDQFISKDEQYRWFQVDYQIGVFISRSSVNFFHIDKLWVFPMLQFLNATVLLLHAFYRFIPSLWIIFAVVLWEGLLGGGAYVNAFYKITNEVSSEKKEYSMGIAALGDSIGIAIAGAVAIPTHNAICDMTIKL